MLKKVCLGMKVMLALASLASCKPSDKYVGDWLAISKDGEKVTINFSKEKTITLIDEADNEENYELNQTGAGFRNSVSYYQVEIEKTNRTQSL